MSIQPLSRPIAVTTFPDQQTILNYINSHPQKPELETEAMRKWFPNNISAIAKHFANMQISHSLVYTSIRGHIFDALLEADTGNLRRTIAFTRGIEMLISQYEKQGMTKGKAIDLLKGKLNSIQLPTWLIKAQNVYWQILEDLLQGKNYRPSTDSEDFGQTERMTLWDKSVVLL